MNASLADLFAEISTDRGLPERQAYGRLRKALLTAECHEALVFFATAYLETTQKLLADTGEWMNGDGSFRFPVPLNWNAQHIEETHPSVAKRICAFLDCNPDSPYNVKMSAPAEMLSRRGTSFGTCDGSTLRIANHLGYLGEGVFAHEYAHFLQLSSGKKISPILKELQATGVERHVSRTADNPDEHLLYCLSTTQTLLSTLAWMHRREIAPFPFSEEQTHSITLPIHCLVEQFWHDNMSGGYVQPNPDLSLRASAPGRHDLAIMGSLLLEQHKEGAAYAAFLREVVA